MDTITTTATANGNGHVPGLLPHHLAELRRSGLTDDTIRAAGIRSETHHVVLAGILNRKRYTRDWGAALVFPFIDASGATVLTRVKPDNPPKHGDKLAKYLQPTGAANRVYVPPGVYPVLNDPTQSVIITEGEKKGMAATQHGFPTIGLTGVDCWHAKGSSALLTDLDRIEWKGRKVYVCFDSDAAQNENVKQNERLLAAALQQHGAVVRVVRLPSGPNGEKVGLDDYLVAHGSGEFCNLLNTADEPEPVDPGELKRAAADMFPESEAENMVKLLTVDGQSTLRFWRGSHWHHRNGAYREVADAETRARVARTLAQGFCKVAMSHVSNVIEHLKAQTLLSERIDAPAWLDNRKHEWAPSDLLVMRNGIIHLPSLVNGGDFRMDPTPALFTTSSLDFDFIDIADCPRPERWRRFLEELWPDDPEAVEALQLWFGYCLTPDTRQQKLFSLIGPKRSGKGTIVRVLQALIGRENCASPTLSSFATNFGLSPLVGKSLAVIADARFSGRADAATIVERILSITGEDAQTIDRKHRDPITVTLPTRIMLVSNELPRLSDSSGALAGRMVVLQLTRSWFGHEDHHLTDVLLQELPGILWWAIEGWAKLRQRGRLIQPASGAELLQEAEDLLSPVSVFVREHCEVGPACEVSRADLYERFQKWAERHGRVRVSDEAGFGRDLRAALPGLKTTQHRVNGRPVRYYTGVGIRIGDPFDGD